MPGLPFHSNKLHRKTTRAPFPLPLVTHSAKTHFSCVYHDSPHTIPILDHTSIVFHPRITEASHQPPTFTTTRCYHIPADAPISKNHPHFASYHILQHVKTYIVCMSLDVILQDNTLDDPSEQNVPLSFGLTTVHKLQRSHRLHWIIPS